MKGNCDLVICQICNKEMSFGRIKRHISSNHKDINIKEYIQLNWNTLPLHNPCEVCKTNIVYKYKTCSKECRHKLEHSHKGKPKPKGFMNEEHKSKLSKSMLGSVGGFKGHSHTKKVVSNIKKRMKNQKYHLGHKQSDLQKTTQSKNMLKYYSEGNEPWTKNNKHTPETIKNIFKFRKINKLEQKVWDLLLENNILFDFQFSLNTNKGKVKFYDFKIKDKPILIEVDGDFWHGNPETNSHFKYVKRNKLNDKIKDKLAKDNGYKLIRIWESEIKSNPQIVINRINECI